MATQEDRATESALEDLLGQSSEVSTDSDADFHVQAQEASDSSSENDAAQPSQDTTPSQVQERISSGAPGTSSGITRNRRPETSVLTHLTHLNTPGLTQQQKNHIRRLRDAERRRRHEARETQIQSRRQQRATQAEIPRRMRDWSATLSFVGRDIPPNRPRQFSEFILRQQRGINVAERGGTVGNKHAQAAFTAEGTSSRSCRSWVIRELGWDQDPPAERFRLVLKEIDGSGGLYESFEAFCGYLQKDRGLYADWQLERTESVTDDMLQIGRSLFSSGFVVVIFSLFGVLVFGGSNELSTLDLFWG